MRAVLQRVTQASVVVDGKTCGQIQTGLVVFLGITHTDTEKECRVLAEKIVRLRIFPDHEQKMNKSLLDCSRDVLLVSQFTLYANTASGRRPDFLMAAPPALAESLYNTVTSELERLLDKPVQRGIFGAKMLVHLVNDGPVTLILDIG